MTGTNEQPEWRNPDGSLKWKETFLKLGGDYLWFAFGAGLGNLWNVYRVVLEQPDIPYWILAVVWAISTFGLALAGMIVIYLLVAVGALCVIGFMEAKRAYSKRFDTTTLKD